MPKPKIDRVLLNQMLRDGQPQNDIAQHFGVTPSAISKAMRELHLSVVKNVTIESAHKVVESNLDSIGQLKHINEKANELLDKAIKAKNNDIAIKCMSEIRGQLRLQLELFEVLYDVKAVQAFQNEVLNLISEVEPDARARIIHRLKAASAIRSAVSFTR